METTKRQMRFFHGPMLDQVCSIIGVTPNRSNKAVLKKFLKRMFNIDSLKDLDTIGMTWFITKVSVFFGTEFGITLDMPGEKNVDDLTLSELLKLTYHDARTTATETRENPSDKNETHEGQVGEGDSPNTKNISKD